MRVRIVGLLLIGGIISISIFFRIGRSQEITPGPPVIEKPLALPDSGPFEKALARYDKFLDASLDTFGTVGAAATVLKGEHIAYTRTYGVTRAGNRDSVNQHTVFRLASVSKGFAGVLMLRLVQEEYLALENTVISYLPDFQLKDSVNTYGLNIGHLLNHTSGLVPHAYDNLVEAGQKMEEILPRLVEVDIALPPGEVYGYQNVLFSLTDTISRLATGKKYGELMNEYVFDPIGMSDASTGYRDLVWNSNVAFPHVRRQGDFYPLPLHTGYYNMLPAAGVNASIHDVALWLKALLGYSTGHIDREIQGQLETPQIKTPLKRAYTRRWDKLDGRFYSFGWRIFDYKGYRIMYHGGYVRGYNAQVAFCPELDTGIAFLQNSPNGLASRCVPTWFNYLIEEMNRE